MMKIAVGFIFILSKRYIIGIQYKPLHKYHKWLYPLQNKLCKIFTPPPPTHTHHHHHHPARRLLHCK